VTAQPDQAVHYPADLTPEQRIAAEKLAAQILTNAPVEHEEPAPVELSVEAATTWSQMRSIMERMARDQEIVDSLKERLRQLGRATYSIGGTPAFVVRPNTRFSSRKAEQILTPDELAKVMRPMVDTKLAGEVLPPERYRACQDEVGVDVVAPIQKKHR
jgi:hypothetical protein